MRPSLLLILCCFALTASTWILQQHSNNDLKGASTTQPADGDLDSAPHKKILSNSDITEPPKERVHPLSSIQQFKVWLTDYLQQSEVNRADIVEAGVQLARRRKVELKHLIQHRPDEAKHALLSLAEYDALPSKIQAHVETLVSDYASIYTFHQCGTHHSGQFSCSKESNLYFYHNKPKTSIRAYGNDAQTEHSPVTAYVIDTLALVMDSPMLTLKAEDISIAQERFALGRIQRIDPISGDPITTLSHAVIIANHLYYFNSDDTVRAAREAILQAIEAQDHTAFAPEGTLSWILGNDGPALQSKFAFTPSNLIGKSNIELLIIRADFSDLTGAAVSRADLEEHFIQGDEPSVDDYLQDWSYGKASLTTTVSSTIYRPVRTATSYAQAGDNDGLYTDILEAYDAAPDAHASENYDVVAVLFPELDAIPDSEIVARMRASLGGKRIWINGYRNNPRFNQRNFLHELGHNYGLSHANYLDPGQITASESYYVNAQIPDSLEYGDIFDVMGTALLPEGQFNHYYKYRLDWITDQQVTEVTAEGTYRIYRFDDAQALNHNTLALCIPFSDGVTYWLGHRQLFADNPNLSNGVYVVSSHRTTDVSNLIDMTPGSETDPDDDRFDAALPVGQEFYDPASGLRITCTATGSDGLGLEWVEVSIEIASTIGLAQSAYEMDESDGMLTVSVERKQTLVGEVSVDYATQNLSATAGSDYTARSGTLTWESGDAIPKQITIPIYDDGNESEGTETFAFNLSNLTGNSTFEFGLSSATLSILDPGEPYTLSSFGNFNYYISAIGFQSDGRAILGGIIRFNSTNDFNANTNIARVDYKTGIVDTDFNTGGEGFNASSQIYSIVIQEDDKILVGGSFTTYNGTSANRLIRLNADGSIDTDFLTNLGTGFNSNVRAIAIEANGDILVAGDFEALNGSPQNGILRLSSAGIPDSTFTNNVKKSGNVFDVRAQIFDILIDDDVGILIGGSFYTKRSYKAGYGFRTGAGIARLNPDGTIDRDFYTGYGLRESNSSGGELMRGYALAQLPDGDYLVGAQPVTGTLAESSAHYNGAPAAFFIRLNPDGSLDRTLGSTFSKHPEKILCDPDGNILVLGNFTTPANRILRINNNWQIDTNYSSGSGPNSTVHTMAYTPSGSLLIGGSLTSFNGESSPRIARIANGTSPYNRWVQRNFSQSQINQGEAARHIDYDNDGLNNQEEFLLGLNPSLPTDAIDRAQLQDLILTTIQDNESSTTHLELSIDTSKLPSGVWICPQVSSDLVNWLPNPEVPRPVSHIDIIDEGPNQIIFRDQQNNEDSPSRFMRVILKTAPTEP